MKEPKIFSFFAGCGFLDLGFEKTGYNICFTNEVSKSFTNAYKYARSKMGIPEPQYGCNIGDINDYLDNRSNELKCYMSEAKSDGSLVGYIGGPPCPDFSVAGKQKGREGDNGKLSQSYVDLICEQKPDFFLFENVKGLWRTAKHRKYYEDLKEQLVEAGFVMTERLTNALEFGVPQDRDRIFLFGVNSVAQPEIAARISNFPWKKNMKYNLEEIRNMPWPQQEKFEADSEKECPKGVPEELTAEYWFKKNHVYSHPNAKDHFIPKAGLQKMKVIPEGDDSKKSYKRLHRWRYAPTVAYGNNEVHLHPYKERRLTVAEALSLQSLPEEYELPPEMTLTDKFKTIGNGVPFLLAAGIAQTIMDYLMEKE